MSLALVPTSTTFPGASAVASAGARALLPYSPLRFRACGKLLKGAFRVAFGVAVPALLSVGVTRNRRQRLRDSLRNGMVVLAKEDASVIVGQSSRNKCGVRNSVACSGFGGAAGDGLRALRSSWFRLPFGKRETAESSVALLERQVAEEDDDSFSPEEELARLSATGPTKVAILGTRECPFQHQQEIEMLSEAHVSRGNHVYTSGSNGTNSAVIKGAMKAGKPQLLTVILPQSFAKQDQDSQDLLRRCMEAGVKVQATPANDKLSLAQAARMCNTDVLRLVKKLVAFASHESQNYIALIAEARKQEILVTEFFLD